MCSWIGLITVDGYSVPKTKLRKSAHFLGALRALKKIYLSLLMNNQVRVLTGTVRFCRLDIIIIRQACQGIIVSLTFGFAFQHAASCI